MPKYDYDRDRATRLGAPVRGSTDRVPATFAEDIETDLVKDDQTDLATVLKEIDRDTARGLIAQRDLAADPDPDDYQTGDTVLVNGRRRKLAVTTETVQRYGAFAVEEIAEADGTGHWHGCSFSDAAIVPSNVGGWGSNPDEEVGFIGWEEDPHGVRGNLQVAIRQSSLRSALGRNEQAGEQLFVEVGWATDSEGFDVTLGSLYFTRSGERYLVFETVLRTGTVWDLGHPLMTYTGSFDLGVFRGSRSDPDLNSRQIFTHSDNVRHWIDFQDSVEADAESRSIQNAGRLDRAEAEIDQLQKKPTPVVVPDDAVVHELDRLPHPTIALPAHAVVPVLPTEEKSRIVYTAKAGGTGGNGWTFKHEYDATAESIAANPTGAVLVNGDHSNAGRSNPRQLAVDGAGVSELQEGLLFTIGADGTDVYMISDLRPGVIITVDPVTADDDAVVEFQPVPVSCSVSGRLVTIGFGPGTTPVKALATAIRNMADFPSTQWDAYPWHFAFTDVTVDSSMTPQLSETELGVDAPSADHDYVQIPARFHQDYPGGSGWSTLPGLYRLTDVPNDLAGNRFRCRIAQSGGYHGFWVPGDYPPSSGPANFGEMIYDPTAGGILGLYGGYEDGFYDYRFVIDEALLYSAMLDRVRYIWATIQNHRERGDEQLDGVVPVVANPHELDLDSIIHNNLVVDIYDPDGAKIGSSHTFNVTGQHIEVGGKRFRVFETLVIPDPFEDLVQYDYVDIHAELDVDHSVSIVRDYVYPMSELQWGDRDILVTGTPGVSARTKAWQAVDIWHPTQAELNRQLHRANARFGGLQFRTLANQAAYNALTPDPHTVYFVDGAGQSDRRIYIGTKRWE